MKGFTLLCCVAATTVSPIEKIIQLIGDLEAKIIKDGEAQQKIYEEFTDHCSDTSKELEFAIKTGKSDAERFSAAVEDTTAQIAALETQIGELATSTSTNQADLKAATEIRDKEHADFLAADADMAESLSMLRRAIAIIEKEQSKTSLLQGDSDSAQRVYLALQSVLNAAMLQTADKAKIQAFLQDDDSQPAGAPAAAAYENKSGGILDMMEDMLEKAEAQAAEQQKAEMTAAHNFAMLKQGLEDAIAQEEKEMAEAKKGKAGAEEAKAEAEGELERTQKAIADGQKQLKDLQHECMTTAEEYDQESHERSDELGALAAAKKIIEEKTGGAAERTYSFTQVKAKLRTRATMRSAMRLQAAGDKVVALLQQISRAEKTQVFAQLAHKVRSALASEADPFAKVKGMIQEMVEKLVKEAAEEAGKKAFCDKEMSETKAKMEDKQSEVDDLNGKSDKFSAKIAKLTESIATLEEELAEIAASQKQADELRSEQKEAWTSAKADFESGLEGIQMALQVLRDYYAEKAPELLQTNKETGAASGIIGMLEVAESDFAKMLAEGQAAEDQAIKEYETMTQDNKVTTASKRTEAKYAAKDKKETQALLEDTKGDLSVSQEELSAIMEYWEKLQPQCVAKPEPYEERKARREREIAGLKQALEILEQETASSFLQRD